MGKVKSIRLIAGIMLLILSAMMIYLCIKGLHTVSSVNSYKDNGTHTFEPDQVLPVLVQNTSAYSRDRHMNSTKTVYMACYWATDGSGYEWSDWTIIRELGQETVKEGVPITRRVLSISSDRTYITIEPNQTAESYIARLW